MKKAVTLIFCLLFCAAPAAAQNPGPPRKERSSFELWMDLIRNAGTTPEKRVRQQAILDEMDARSGSRQAIPAPDQEPVPSPSSVTLPVDFNPTLCLYNCPPPPANVGPSVLATRNSGVPRVRNEGLTVDQLLGRASLPPSKGLPKPGEYGAVSIKGLPYDSLRGPAGSAKIDRTLGNLEPSLESVGRKAEAVTRGVEELGRLNQQFAPSVTPSMPRPARPALPEMPWGAIPSAAGIRGTEDVTASASSHRTPDIRKVLSGNPSGRATVRSNPGGYIVGSVRDGDEFRVRAYQPRGKGCWMLGDVVGSQYLRDVWIDCDDLPGPDRAMRRATDAELPDNASESEADLGRRFASVVLPSTDCSDSRDSKYLTDVRRDVEPDKLKLYGNYNPVTKQLTGEINSVIPGNVIKVRYLSDDHLAAAVNYVIIDASGKRVDNQWGFVSTGILALPLREDKSPCLNPTR